MRSFITLAVTTLLVACTGQAPAEDTDPQDPAGTVPGGEIPDDTGFPPGDLGGFHIDFGTLANPATLSAVFTESSPGFVNLAQCAVNTDVPCLTLFPNDEDEFILPDTSRELDRDTVNTRFLGFEIGFAGYTLNYREDPDNGFGYYSRTLTEKDAPPQGWVGASWGGQWPDFQGDNLLFVSEPMELIFPRPGAHIKFHNGERFPVEWVPTGDGLVTLQVGTPGNQIMYLLEDDGYYEIVADELGISSQIEDVTFAFTRWDKSNIRKFGHVIDLLSTSKQQFTGEYFNIGNRDELEGADRCAEATGLDPLLAGGFWGDLGWYEADLNPDEFCVNPGCAYGYDGIYKVEVPPKNLLQIEYNVYLDSAAMYLLTDCTDEFSCFRASDLDSNVNAPEFMNYFNPSDDLRRFYLIVDSTGDGGCPTRGSSGPVKSYYTLDVGLDPLTEPDMYDSCVDAEDAAPIFPGNYYAERTAYLNDLNPGVGGCTASSVRGADAMTPVDVQPGQTLTVNVNMPGADPAIYFLYQCDDAFSCPFGSDRSIDEREVASYTNNSGATERIYIVVDSQDGILPYFMSIGF